MLLQRNSAVSKAVIILYILGRQKYTSSNKRSVEIYVMNFRIAWAIRGSAIPDHSERPARER